MFLLLLYILFGSVLVGFWLFMRLVGFVGAVHVFFVGYGFYCLVYLLVFWCFVFRWFAFYVCCLVWFSVYFGVA